MTTKRLFLIALAGLLIVGIGLLLTSPGGAGYRADSRVIVQPYSNAFFPRSFESHLIQTIPGVLGLRVTPTYGAIPRSGAPVLTNGVSIHISAGGATPEEAQRAANEAATSICQTALTNYGITGRVVERANTARSYSYFHDGLKPAVGRLFKR